MESTVVRFNFVIDWYCYELFVSWDYAIYLPQEMLWDSWYACRFKKKKEHFFLKNALHSRDKTHKRSISSAGLTLISRCPVYRIDRQNQYVQRLLFKRKAYSCFKQEARQGLSAHLVFLPSFLTMDKVSIIWHKSWELVIVEEHDRWQNCTLLSADCIKYFLKSTETPLMVRD